MAKRSKKKKENQNLGKRKVLKEKRKKFLEKRKKKISKKEELKANRRC